MDGKITCVGSFESTHKTTFAYIEIYAFYTTLKS